jgi:hypothetical protein
VRDALLSRNAPNPETELLLTEKIARSKTASLRRALGRKIQDGKSQA